LFPELRKVMAFNNMANVAVDPNVEEQLFLDEVAAVKKWWSDSRWRYTRRPFTAEQIVSKRGNLKIEYPSNTQSKKLWKILEGRFQVCCVPGLTVTTMLTSFP
jgi:isocitrate lyase